MPNVDEAECRASCLLEETCLAVQYSADMRGCKLLDTTRRSIVAKRTSKIVVFLPRLQRERKTLVLNDLKVKTDQPPRHSLQAANMTVCNASCSRRLLCSLCHVSAGTTKLVSDLQELLVVFKTTGRGC